MYRKHPEWLFTTPQQRFDLLYTGHFAHGFVIQLPKRKKIKKNKNEKNIIDIQSKELF